MFNFFITFCLISIHFLFLLIFFLSFFHLFFQIVKPKFKAKENIVLFHSYFFFNKFLIGLSAKKCTRKMNMHRSNYENPFL